jgi:hypothetical protein
MASSGRRLRAWVALVAFSSMFGLGLATTGHFNDDTACGETSLVAGHLTTGFTTPTPAPVTAHCPFCHWQRAVSGAAAVSADGAVVTLEAVELARPSSTRAVASTAVADRPSRAPPSLHT